MVKLVMYLRACFCKHDFKLLKHSNIVKNPDDEVPIGSEWVYRCRKCGYVDIVRNFK